MGQPNLMPAQQISLLDIYTEQIKMGADMKTLKETLPDHETRIRTLQDQMPPHLEERLNSLETSRAKVLGAAAAVSLIASAGGTWMALLITHH